MSTGYRRTCLSISYHMPCSGGDRITWSFVLLPMPSLPCFPRLLLSPLPPSSDLSFSSAPLLFLSMCSFSLLLITFPWPLFSLPHIARFFFLSSCPLCASLRQGPPCLQAGWGAACWRVSSAQRPGQRAGAATLRSPHSSRGGTERLPCSKANGQTLTRPHSVPEN